MRDEEGRFLKGVSGNPGGRPPLPDDVKSARQMNVVELHRILNHLLTCSRDELQQIIKNPESNMVTLTVASILTNATNKGDPQRLSFILDRLLGKPKESIEISNPYMEMPIDELKALVKKKIESNE